MAEYDFTIRVHVSARNEQSAIKKISKLCNRTTTYIDEISLNPVVKCLNAKGAQDVMLSQESIEAIRNTGENVKVGQSALAVDESDSVEIDTTADNDTVQKAAQQSKVVGTADPKNVEKAVAEASVSSPEMDSVSVGSQKEGESESYDLLD